MRTRQVRAGGPFPVVHTARISGVQYSVGRTNVKFVSVIVVAAVHARVCRRKRCAYVSTTVLNDRHQASSCCSLKKMTAINAALSGLPANV